MKPSPITLYLVVIRRNEKKELLFARERPNDEWGLPRILVDADHAEGLDIDRVTALVAAKLSMVFQSFGLKSVELIDEKNWQEADNIFSGSLLYKCVLTKNSVPHDFRQVWFVSGQYVPNAGLATEAWALSHLSYVKDLLE